MLPHLARKAWTPCWENLQKLAWLDGFAFASHGVRIGVRVSDPALLPMLRKRLPPGATRCDARTVDRYFSVILGGRAEGSRIRKYNLVYLDHARLARSFELDDVLDAFESWVGLSVADLSPTRVFVHAGVVGWNGRAILIPGTTHSGKTSLVVELVKAGATYYSDEFAVLDARGRAHPFPRPPAVRENGAGRQRPLALEEIGGTAGAKPLPVGLVVLSEYAADAQWRPRRPSPGRAALALLANTVSARRAPERALAVLQRVTAEAPALQGRRGEAQAAARAILAAADQNAPAPDPALRLATRAPRVDAPALADA